MHKYLVMYMVTLNTTPPQQTLGSMNIQSSTRICDFPDVVGISNSILATLKQQGAIPPNVEAIVQVLTFKRLESAILH